MQDHVEVFWKMRLEQCKDALERNNFKVFLAAHSDEANRIVIDEILPKLKVTSVSWGDSLTFLSTKILDTLRHRKDIEIVETFSPEMTREQSMQPRRQALLVDLFFTGTNAVTESGQLVNLDMVGNRVAGLTFGPRHVIVFIGRNKIVADVDAAMKRIRSYAAPLNAIRHPKMKTPCRKTSFCMDCKSPDRICNTWTITEKSYPPGRVHVVLINDELGL